MDQVHTYIFEIFFIRKRKLRYMYLTQNANIVVVVNKSVFYLYSRSTQIDLFRLQDNNYILVSNSKNNNNSF